MLRIRCRPHVCPSKMLVDGGEHVGIGDATMKIEIRMNCFVNKVECQH
jgi:hypothetical protein